jgi:hypothetical protein
VLVSLIQVLVQVLVQVPQQSRIIAQHFKSYTPLCQTNPCNRSKAWSHRLDTRKVTDFRNLSDTMVSTRTAKLSSLVEEEEESMGIEMSTPTGTPAADEDMSDARNGSAHLESDLQE